MFLENSEFSENLIRIPDGSDAVWDFNFLKIGVKK